MARNQPSNTFTEDYWEELLDNIKQKQCTPFIGAGACHGILPLARDIAEGWATSYGYPLEDKSDLARVAQFLAIKKSEIFPKREIQKQLNNKKLPDFSEPDEPHGILADLNLPIYITTNYDNFMFQALKRDPKRDPKEEFCRWNKFTLNYDYVPKPVFDSGYKPSPSSPVVYHLHGSMEIPQSMVLTESDYLDFLIGLSTADIKLPPSISLALASTSLLFVGYSLADWDFRVLFRGLINVAKANASYSSVAVQLLPSILDQRKEEAFAYLDQYLEKIHGVKLHVYRGPARQFSTDLRKHWEKVKNVEG